MTHHARKKEAVLKELRTSEKGLTNTDARLRLQKYGKNVIKEIYKINPIKIFFLQFKSFLIYILLAAIVISIIIQHYIDAGVIFAIVMLNATLGFIQQYKSEKSIIELKKLLVPKTKVMRGGKMMKISSKEIVPGDILILHEGDKITADCRVLEAENIEVNEAILTGESFPVEKFSEILPKNTILAERTNMLFTGTSVVKGKVIGVVVATGMSTEFGKIAKMLQTIELQETPMQKKMDKFAKQITFVILGILAVMLVIGFLSGQEKIQMFLTAIALAVSAIPEGLPAVITISLAFATNSMLKRNTIIRRLPAAETLGSVTIICADKTGTMTEEKMVVREIFSNNKFFTKKDSTISFKNKKVNLTNQKELSFLFKTAVLASNARFEKVDEGKVSQENRRLSGRQQKYEIYGDPTESALVTAGLNLGINRKFLTEQEPRIGEFSFTSERKMMSIIRKAERRNVMYAKGASSVILEKCTQEYVNGGVKKLTAKRKKDLTRVAEKMEGGALRVLAFGFKYVKGRTDMKEDNFIFVGFIGMLDPPRPEVKRALSICKSAGIKIKMITGDSALTALAIAKEIGLEQRLMTGIEFEKLSDHKLAEKIEETTIFARINPKQKLKIVEILRQKGEQVAITGDGVNDVLALKKADIGVAMGKRGSDVAREVSDMILADDNFASIVNAVEEGRTVYDNTKKATKFLLAANFAEIFLILYTILARLPLPLLPLQILWINLVTDSFPALALTREKGENVMKTKPRKEKSILNGILKMIIFVSIVNLIMELIVFHYGLNHFPIEKTRTILLMCVVGFEVLFSFSCRSDKELRKIGFFTNKWIIYAFLLAIVLQVVLIFTPLSSLFGVVALSGSEWLIVLAASLPGIVVFEGWKFVRGFRKK